ncbi:hypothetical protein BV22DRAFT_1024776 [Leucogyrophana mollusca]|uniref:Uncharacterized protein n=1 Tax=Leucogyrophana mollusca TaxID=85980 RepID=A0ACB8AZB6_9AGAM|nr:hypothetical protein BV22DRAFT_1024776 [Leucogyrophana mollusca]
MQSSKKTKGNLPLDTVDGQRQGLKWDCVNYSCAYDALFTMLLNIWCESPMTWNKTFRGFGPFMDCLIEGFQRAYRGTGSLENTRDRVRVQLNSSNATLFPQGRLGASVGDLALAMLDATNAPSPWLLCNICNTRLPIQSTVRHVFDVGSNTPVSTTEWLMKCHQNRTPAVCTGCLSPVSNQWHCDAPPKIIAMNISDQPVRISPVVKIMGKARSSSLYFRGIVYYGDFHFTSQFVSRENKMFFHNGIKDGSTHLSDKSCLNKYSTAELSICNGCKASLVVYAKV